MAQNRALLFAACALLLSDIDALARDVAPGTKAADRKQADASRVEVKRSRDAAQVDRQLRDLVKKRRTRNGWLGDGSYPENVRAIKDLSYAEKGGSESQKLDLYIPSVTTMEGDGRIDSKTTKPNFAAKRKNLSTGWPLVVWIHGGGWRGGDKKGGPFRALLESGFAVASINYRLSGEEKWPAQLDDCRSALAYLRSHSAEYDIDSKRIGLWGGSAGGHLALMLALKGDKPDSDRKQKSEHQSVGSDLAAVCDWFGPTDLARFVINGETTRQGAEMIQQLFGLEGEALISACTAASPVTYISHAKHVPPILIMHGKADKLVSIKQSQRLLDKMKAAGITSVRLVELNGGHGYPGFGAGTILDVIKFFQEKLRG
ncbi:MAG: alpha/beta hydrolase [Candidatus Melainabacteria bacterium]|nr:alpha/beta hydrolase [Candidatus Melainabacteria bacterium]